MRYKILILLILWTTSVFAQKSDALDDVLRFVPMATTYTLKLEKVDSRSDWKELLVSTATTVVVCCGTTFALKYIIKKDRPDGSDNHSFPSGHTSFVFASAHQLHKEFGKVSPWISVGGYAVAAFVGVDRIVRERHDWVDVTVGAAIGIASTEFGYWLGEKIIGKKKKKDMALSVSGNQVYFAMNF